MEEKLPDVHKAFHQTVLKKVILSNCFYLEHTYISLPHVKNFSPFKTCINVNYEQIMPV